MSRSSKFKMLIFSVPLASLMAACQPEINHRGYYVQPGTLSQVTEGMPKSQVEAILGSPSTTASVNLQGDSYYYITSVTEARAFLSAKETSRQVIAIRFDKQDRVTSTAQYGLQDGRVININSEKTAIVGSDFSFIRELLRGTGVGNSENMLKRKF